MTAQQTSAVTETAEARHARHANAVVAQRLHDQLAHDIARCVEANDFDGARALASETALHFLQRMGAQRG